MKKSSNSYWSDSGKPFAGKATMSTQFPSFRDSSGTQNGTEGTGTQNLSMFDSFSGSGRVRKQDAAPTVTTVSTEAKPFGNAADSFTTAHTKSDPFGVKKNPASASYTEAGSSQTGGPYSRRNAHSMNPFGETRYSMKPVSKHRDWTNVSIPMLKPTRSDSSVFRQDDFPRGFNAEADPGFQAPRNNRSTHTGQSSTMPSTQQKEVRQNRNSTNHTDLFLLGFQNDGLDEPARMKDTWSDTESGRKQMSASKESDDDKIFLLSYNELVPSALKRKTGLTPAGLVEIFLDGVYPTEEQMEALGIDAAYVRRLYDDVNNHHISEQEAVDKVTRDVNGSNSYSNLYEPYHTPDSGYWVSNSRSLRNYRKYDVPVLVEGLRNGYFPDDEELEYLGISRAQARELMKLLDTGSMTQLEAVGMLEGRIYGNRSDTGNDTGEQYNALYGVDGEKSISDLPVTREEIVEYADSLVKSILSGVVPEEELEGLGVDSSALNRLVNGLANGTITEEEAIWRILKSYSGTSESDGWNNEIIERPSSDLYGVEQYRNAIGTQASDTLSSVQKIINDVSTGRRKASSLSYDEISQIARYYSDNSDSVKNTNTGNSISSIVGEWVSQKAGQIRNINSGMCLRSAIYRATGWTLNDGTPWPALLKYQDYWFRMSRSQQSRAKEILDLYDNRADEILGGYLNGLIARNELMDTPEFDLNKFINGIFHQGIVQMNDEVISTLCALDDLTYGTFFPGNEFSEALSMLNESSHDLLEETRKEYSENARAGYELGLLINELGANVVANAPLIILGIACSNAVLACGGAAAISSISGSTGTAAVARKFFSDLIVRPCFWSSVITSFGDNYEKAKAENPDKVAAAQYAIWTTFMNAMIDAKSGGSGSIFGNIISSSFENGFKSFYERCTMYAFVTEGDVFSQENLREYWGDFVMGGLEEALSQGISYLGGRIKGAIQESGMYDLTPNYQPLDTEEQFRAHNSEALERLGSNDMIKEAYHYYLCEMALVTYKGTKMNYMEFLNEKLKETSGYAKPKKVAEAFELLFQEQLRAIKAQN